MIRGLFFYLHKKEIFFFTKLFSLLDVNIIVLFRTFYRSPTVYPEFSLRDVGKRDLPPLDHQILFIDRSQSISANLC